MLFNSLDFAIFLPIVFIIYWFVFNKNLKLQNLFLLIVSYIFYGWWDWRFLILIAVSTLIDFFVGWALLNQQKPIKRKLLLWVSLIGNLGILGYFKYYNFFVESFVQVFSFFGQEIGMHSLHIILPVGISFYTFQTMSYSIDVYRKQTEPTKNLIDFAAFVSFFPQLVAGPIERAKNLLPQIQNKRTFDYEKASNGMRQILWGLFKKVVIADNCAQYADQIFSDPNSFNGSTLFIGSILFTLQIYSDFSGYSDIAIGSARLFGFSLIKNFSFPFFSKNVIEFWQRWHISLTTWLRDYIYKPLGFSRLGSLKMFRNNLIVFSIVGLWHGADWTFIIWGIVNVILMQPTIFYRKLKGKRVNKNLKINNKIISLFQIAITFISLSLSSIFFRVTNFNSSITIFSKIFSSYIFQMPQISILDDNVSNLNFTILFLFLMIFNLMEWNGRKTAFALESFGNNWHKLPRHLLYYTIIVSILWFGGPVHNYIYFQF